MSTNTLLAIPIKCFKQNEIHANNTINVSLYQQLNMLVVEDYDMEHFS